MGRNKGYDTVKFPNGCNEDCLNCIHDYCMYEEIEVPVYMIRGFNAKEFRTIDYMVKVMVMKGKLESVEQKHIIYDAIKNRESYLDMRFAKPELSPTYCSYAGKFGDLIVRKHNGGYAIYDGTNIMSPTYKTCQLAQMVLDVYSEEHEAKITHVFKGELPPPNVCIF